MNTDRKLKGKDLMNIGIFSAIIFVIMTAVGMLGFIPIFIPLLSVIAPLIGGIPFMLFLTRVKKFGMIWILCIIQGLMMMLTGMGVYPLIVGAICGLAAEFVYKSGNYKSAGKAVLTCGFSFLWVFGCELPLFLDIEGYFSTRQNFGQEYIDTLTSLMSTWMCPVLLVTTFVCGLLGGLLGKALLKKHFKKAGIA
ncbi:MptD family putative ECF transporter S component [Eisenbergiella sp.]